MNDQVLSIEQMQELIELGIDISRASMFWYIDGKFKQLIPCSNQDTIGDWTNQYGENCIIPTFTLQDILEMLPKVSNYHLEVHPEDNTLMYITTYGAYHCLSCFEEKTLLQSAFNMLKWCKQNKLI